MSLTLDARPAADAAPPPILARAAPALPLPRLPPAPGIAARHYRPPAPLRAPRFPWAARQWRRACLLLRWTLTGQVLRHARCFLAARREAAAAAARGVLAGRLVPSLIRQAVAAEIVIAASETPLVSVIVPSYGQVPFTLRCLAALAAHPPAAAIEVLVIDDASPDPAVAELAAVRGIRLIRHDRNLGFLHSCNATAKMARGRYLLLLNNDTQMLQGALDAMVATFAAVPEAGIVGAKLLFPDGTLQEAGGIVWADGSAWNFGRGDDAGKAEYNYLRDADYVSGAALMLPRALFAALGGFDPRYAPAYCEDSDLAFRVRAAGYRVLYQPRATVVHCEGVSHGTDPAHGIKAAQAINQARLAARWADTLAREHGPNGCGVLRARDRAGSRRVVLIADHWVPEPDRDAGSRTMAALIAGLRAGGAVVKFWPANGHASAPYTEALTSQGVEVLWGLGEAQGRAPGLAAWLARHGDDLDDVLLSRPGIAETVLPLIRRHSDARVFFYGHDLHFARLRAEAAQAGGDAALAGAARLMERRERALWRRVDCVLTPSAEEAAVIAALEPRAEVRAIIPFGFADFPALRTAPPAGREVLFVAGFRHPPNVASLLWFAEAVLPALRQAVPDATLRIVGSHPPAAVRALAGPAIVVEADVSDARLAACYGAARVAAVPLRFGAGVKMKVVEALRHGLPLVTTRVGAQGLPGLDGVAGIEDSPAGFAAALAALLTDDAAWAARSAAGRDYARTGFSAAAQTRCLLAAFAAAG